MNIAVDLHIHSALSPCADDNMTPNNIVNMALLKGLDAIGITDHNSCDNIEPIIEVAKSKILVVPGIEIETREEVHLLCYFKLVNRLQDFACLVKKKLSNIRNVPEIFGNQLIMNSRDEVIGERDELLISSVDLSVDEVLKEVERRAGIVVPAHIDRPSNSVISQLGFIPENLSRGMLEISRNCLEFPPGYSREKFYYSSDAHKLGLILERESFIQVKNLTLSSILKTLSQESVR